jgi:dTDP-D-glucose 4,6-dehydratase
MRPLWDRSLVKKNYSSFTIDNLPGTKEMLEMFRCYLFKQASDKMVNLSADEVTEEPPGEASCPADY